MTQRLFTEINGFAVLLRGYLLWLKPFSVTVPRDLPGSLQSNLETLRFDELAKDRRDIIHDITASPGGN